jgi:Flp pilus assembly protein TadB
LRRPLTYIFLRVLDAAGVFVGNVLGREVANRREHLSEEERRELESWETFEALTTLTRTFNRDAAGLSAPGHPDQAGASLEALFALPSPSPVNVGTARQVTMERAPRWCRLYAIADALAQRWQVQFGRDWFHIYVWAMFAFLCFVFFANVGAFSNVLLIVYVLGFLGIVVVVGRAHVERHQGRFRDYRALAEALRVAMYWRTLGIASPNGEARDPLPPGVHDPGTIADAYPIKQPSELAW